MTKFSLDWTLPDYIELRFDGAGITGSRHRVTGDEPFGQWVKGYGDAIEKRKSNSLFVGDFLDLGDQMGQWLESIQQNWYAKVMKAGITAPLIMEVVVPADSNSAQNLFLEVPWELLAWDRFFLAQNEYLKYSPVRRYGTPAQDQAPSDFRLSLLFMASSPQGVTDLSYEQEEAAILTVCGNPGHLDLHVEESGTKAGLLEKANECRPDILHLSCHGNIDPVKQVPFLAFEDDQGGLDLVKADDLAEQLGEKRSRLLFISACKSSEPGRNNESLAVKMIRHGFSSVAGWASSVSDQEAITFAAEFYRRLSEQNSVEAALAFSRYALASRGIKDANPPSCEWHLARLYLRPDGGGKLSTDVNRHRVINPAQGIDEFLDTDKQVKVASRFEFVGRRRQIQAILKEIKEPRHAGILIHGMGAHGKSSLAARAANRLTNYKPVVIVNHYDPLYILEKIVETTASDEADRILREKKERVAADPSSLYLILKQMIEKAFDCVEINHKGQLIKSPILLIIDDLEQIITLPTQEQCAPLIRVEYEAAIAALIKAFDRAASASRLLFTSRFLFSLKSREIDLAGRLLSIPLLPMTNSELVKMVNQREELGAINAVGGNTIKEKIPLTQGNPGIAFTLIELFGASQKTGQDALAALALFDEKRELPRIPQITALFDRLRLNLVLAALSQAQLHLLESFQLFFLPLPQTALVVLSAACDLEKLVNLGLVEPSPDPVDPSAIALSLNPLIRLFLKPLTPDQEKEICAKLSAPLAQTWTKPGQLAWAAPAYQLSRISLIASNAAVLILAIEPALWWLNAQNRFKEAAPLALEGYEILKNEQIPFGFYSIASEVTHTTGCVEEAALFLETARNLIHTRGHASFELNDILHVLVNYSRQLVQKGEPDQALAQLEACEALITDKTTFIKEQAIIKGEIALIITDKGDVDEALKLYEQIMIIVKNLGYKRGEAVTMGAIARIMNSKGDVDEALKLHEQMVVIFKALGDKRSEAVTMGDIARIITDKGDVDEALKLHEQMVVIFKALGDKRSEAVTMGDIARIMSSKGDVDEALKLHEAKLSIVKALGDKRGEAVTMGDIARIMNSKGDVDEALKLHEAKLSIVKALGDKRSEAVTMGDIARIMRSKGDVDEALKLHEQIKEIYIALGSKRDEAIAMGDIARIITDKGDVDEALKLHEGQLKIFRTLGDKREEAIAMGDIARIMSSKGDVDEALKLHEERQKIYKALGDKRSEAVTMGDIAFIKASSGDLKGALKINEEKIKIITALGDKDSIAKTHFDIGQCYAALSQKEEAFASFSIAYQLNIELGRLDGIAFVGMNLGQLLCEKGQTDEGIALLQQSKQCFIKLQRNAMVKQVDSLLQLVMMQKLAAEIKAGDGLDSFMQGIEMDTEQKEELRKMLEEMMEGEE